MLSPGEMAAKQLVMIFEEIKPRMPQTSYMNQDLAQLLAHPCNQPTQVVGRPMQILAVNIPFVVVCFLDTKVGRMVIDTRKFKLLEISPEFVEQLFGTIIKPTSTESEKEKLNLCTKDLNLPLFSVGRLGSQCQCSSCRNERKNQGEQNEQV